MAFSALYEIDRDATPHRLPWHIKEKVKWFRRLQKIAISGSGGERAYNLFETGVGRWLNSLPVDIIHLHWVGNQLIGWGDLAAIEKPMVWTFHDTWPLISSLHYQGCMSDPPFGYLESRFLRARNAAFSLRSEKWSAIGPSGWMSGVIKSSGLFRPNQVYHIPYCMEIPPETPFSKGDARKHFGLPLDAKIFIAGANLKSDPRKGLDLLAKAWEAIQVEGMQLVIFGGSGGQVFKSTNVQELSTLDQDQLRILFAAADWLVSPSLEENFSNLIIESMMSGLPVIGFPAGGTPDLVLNEETGLLATEISVNGLVNVLEKAKSKVNPGLLGSRAHIRTREIVDCDKIVAAHESVYEGLLRDFKK